MSRKETLGPDCLTGEFRVRKINSTQTLPKNREEGALPTWLYEARTTLTPRPDKDVTKNNNKQNYRPASLTNTDAKSLTQC